jgi:hypothetical protein
VDVRPHHAPDSLPALGLIAALLTCFYPHFLLYSSILMSETLFIPAYYGALLLFMRAMERPRGWALLRAGLAAGAVVLIRPAVVSLAPVALAAVLKASMSGKRRIRALALVMAGGLAVLGPWALRNLVAYGHFVLIAPNGAMTLAASNNPESTGGHTQPPPVGGKNVWEREELYMQVVRNCVAERPVDALLLLPARKWSYFWLFVPPWPLHAFNPQLFLGEHFFPYVSWLSVLLLGSVGVGALVARHRPWAWLTPACFLCYTGFYMLFYGSARFRLPAEGFFLVWSGAGLVAIARLIPRLAAARAGAWATGIGILLVLVLGQSGWRGAAARAYLESPESLLASGPTFEVNRTEPSIPLFEGGAIPLDRGRSRFVRLSFGAYRQGPYRITPHNGSVKITFLDKKGRSLQYRENVVYTLMAIPPDRWTRMTIKAAIPPMATACRVTLHPDRGSPDTLGIGQPTLRLAKGNDLFLEGAFPYFRYEE